MSYWPLLLSILPFIVLIYLLFRRKTSLLFASGITLVIYNFLAIFYWKIIPKSLLISYSKGTMQALDIFLIIFGAIFFLEILKELGVLKSISKYLSFLSKDYRIQVILIAWFFIGFLEGTSGFGTPAAAVIPILVSMGFAPFQSLIVALLGNSVVSVFGAIGTPIKIGLFSLGTSSLPVLASILNFTGVLLPLFIVYFAGIGRKNHKKEFMEILPFVVLSGFLVHFFAYISARFLGVEFPTLIGWLAGLIVIIPLIKLGVLIPKEEVPLKRKEDKEIESKLSLFKSFFPYIVLITFLLLGKFIIGTRGLSFNLGYPAEFKIFNPGLIFILTGILTSFIYKNKVKNSAKSAIKRSLKPLLILIIILATVQIMVNVGNNASGFPSAMQSISLASETRFLPIITPFAGAFGAFLTGSVTSSNIMMGNIINNASVSMGLNVDFLLALLAVGAGVGNMLALTNILTAEAVLGLKNSEVKIVKSLLIPSLIMLLLLAFIGGLRVLINF